MSNRIPHKIHLSGLPDLRKDQVPPVSANASKRGLVLIPVYQSTPRSHGAHHVTHHVAVSAVWMRRTWLLYSDAADYGVEVKFYVEHKVRDEAMAVFENNFVDEDRDVIYFDGSHIEGALHHIGVSDGDSASTFGAKKCAFYTDYRFKEYDWVFDIDSDIFVWSKNGEKLPFFQNFFDATPDGTIGGWWWTESYDPVALYWCRSAYGNTTEASIEDWKERFETFAGREMLEKYCSPRESFMNCHGGLTSFPAKHFMTHRKADCEWLVSAARVLASSEATLSLWHSMGNPIFDMKDLCFHIVYQPHFTAADFADFQARIAEARDGKPFLFHYAQPSIDYEFREVIGINENRCVL